MNSNNTNLSAAPLPPTQVALCLIKEELKSRKFFNTLRSLGLDNSYYQPHLDELILSYVGLNDELDETFDFYYSVMEKYSASINKDEKSMMGEAVEVYIELMGLRW